MRERLKLGSARARQAEANAPLPLDIGPNGRPVVRYADMPDLDASDMSDIVEKFEMLACPHAAVLEYRPGYESRNYSKAQAQDDLEKKKPFPPSKPSSLPLPIPLRRKTRQIKRRQRQTYQARCKAAQSNAMTILER